MNVFSGFLKCYIINPPPPPHTPHPTPLRHLVHLVTESMFRSTSTNPLKSRYSRHVFIRSDRSYWQLMAISNRDSVNKAY